MSKCFKDMNQVIVVGRLTRDCSVLRTHSGKILGKLSLAVNRLTRNNGEVDSEACFFDVLVFGKTVENIGSYLTKGTRIGVTGELKQDRWESQGQKHTKVVIQAQDVQLLDSPMRRGESREPAKKPARVITVPLPKRPRTHAEFTGVKPPPKEPSLYDGADADDFDSDIPF